MREKKSIFSRVSLDVGISYGIMECVSAEVVELADTHG